jgi:hypothetical protein
LLAWVNATAVIIIDLSSKADHQQEQGGGPGFTK